LHDEDEEDALSEHAVGRLAAMVGVLLTLATLGASAGEETYKVVVNRDNTLTSISRKDLSAIVLRRKPDWADGTTAWPVDQIESASARVGF
jgi:hypothetical protein